MAKKAKKQKSSKRRKWEERFMTDDEVRELADFLHAYILIKRQGQSPVRKKNRN